MKKKFLLTLLISFITLQTAVYGIDSEYEGFAITPEDLGNERFYQSPLSNSGTVPQIRNQEINYSFDNQGRSYKELEDGQAPLFKQIRLKLTNTINNRRSKVSEVDYLTEYEQTNRSILQRLKFRKKAKKTTQTQEQTETSNENLQDKGMLSEYIQEHINSDKDVENTLSLESGISEQVVQKELLLDAENVSYDDETGDMVATGRPILRLPQQNTTIIADKMVYNQDSNIMKSIGNVIVKRSGMTTLADYIEVDMNEETIISDNIEAQPNAMKLNAEHGVQKDGLIILNNGYFHSDKSEIHRLSSRMVGPRFSNMILEDEDKSFFLGNPEEGNKVQVDIRDLYVEARKNHDVIKAKGIKISKNGRKILSWPSLTAYTNKERDYFEANYPELGSRRKVGMFIGPGFSFGGPGGSIMKLIPFLNYKNEFGLGAALKYRSPYNSTELGYGSSNDIFFLKGIQRLDDNLFLQYSANTYADEWFLGSRMPRYMVEAYYDKRHVVKNFLAENRHLSFRHRAGFGLMQDNDRNFYGEKIKSDEHTTTRLRYMAEIKQNLYAYENPEKKLYFNFDFLLQGSAAVYGTGDTQFIARGGPRAHLQYKNWMQDIGYFQSGFDDNTPLPRYDKYRYGHSSVNISEIFRINKYLSVGWTGTVTLSNDSPNKKLFQENRFAIAIGPDDLKIRVGYDFVRQTTYFGFDLAFDTKGTSVNYGRMEIKNPERLGKKEKNENSRQLAFAPAEKQVNEKQQSTNKQNQTKPAVLQYAKVINLEDPNKEQVD